MTLAGTSGVLHARFTPDGRSIVGGSVDGWARLWSATTGRPVTRAFRGHTGAVFWESISPDGRTLATGSSAAWTGVEEVKDQLQYLEPLFSALTVATYIAVGIAALMLVAAVLLIATTIRLSAYARRRELGIMRLVGASNRFIQTPFILEGVFAALLGSLLAGAAVLAGVHFGVDQYLRRASSS